jgi:selenocysteine-specific elongation factor
MIDRVFTVSGFGTVVTGTLIDGQLAVGQEVEILPQGLRSRIRGLQSHKTKVDQVGPGSRVAINLTSLSIDDVHRGNIVTLPDWLTPTQLVDTRLRCLADAPRPLKHNQLVEVYSGSTEVTAHLRVLGTREILPGQEGWVQLRLAHRIPLVKGDHFIIRQPSPSLTIGGGVVVDPLPRRRHRRFRPALIERLETLAHGTPAELLVETLDRVGPIQVRDLLRQNPLSAPVAENVLQQLLQTGEIFQLPRNEDQPEAIANPQNSKVVVASRVGWRNLLSQLQRVLAAYHQENPLRLGMPRGELKSRLRLETGLFNRAMEQAGQETIIAGNETTVWLADHQPEFSPTQQKMVEVLLNRFRANPFGTPSLKESVDMLGNNEELLGALIESSQLVRIAADTLFLPETYAQFLDWLRSFVAKNGSVTVAQVRDAFQTSRKYALALLEHTDSQGVTRRVGDERILR